MTDSLYLEALKTRIRRLTGDITSQEESIKSIETQINHILASKSVNEQILEYLEEKLVHRQKFEDEDESHG